MSQEPYLVPENGVRTVGEALIYQQSAGRVKDGIDVRRTAK